MGQPRGVRLPARDESWDGKTFYHEYDCDWRANLLTFLQPDDFIKGYKGYNGAYFTLESPADGLFVRLAKVLRFTNTEPTYGGPDLADQIVGLLETHALPMFADLSSNEGVRDNLNKYRGVLRRM